MDAGLSIEQLLSALQRKGIPLPFEMGTFLVLEATEQVLTLEATGQTAGFCVVGPAQVWLSEQGEVAVDSETHATEQQACHSLVVLLSDLLVRSAPGVPAMLLEIVEQGPSDGEWSLMRLRDDLEASLVPLNRSATRRVLSRLLREVRRDVERSPSQLPDAGSLDREFDAVFGIESAAEPGSAKPASTQQAQHSIKPRAERHEEDVTAEVELDELLPHPAPAAGARAGKTRGSARASGSKKESAQARAQPDPRSMAAAGGEGLDQFEQAASRGGGSGVRIGLGLALLAGTLGAAYVMLGQQGSRSALGLTPRPEPAASEQPAAPQAPRKPRPRVGELRVSSTPARAQVLLLIGTAPVVVPKLPLGVAHEFVAVAQGATPSRAIVPPDAHWQQEGGEQRYELALQLGDATARHGQDELGATRMPQDVGRPQGALGNVRIITSPPGAKVYQLIGFTPDVRVENLEITPQVELLVYLAGHGLQRVIVGEADWKQQPSGLVAELDVKLTARGK